ncbi:MAG: nucleoside hydrolase [bacterium]
MTDISSGWMMQPASVRCKEITVTALLLALCTFSALAWADGERNSVPIIYTTDLYHPHDDPDDHFDLATLFAIPEFDIRAIVIDRGERGADRPAIAAIRQIMRITKWNVPYACGLIGNLTAPTDCAKSQPPEDQAGVSLILRVLRESEQPVTVFTTGSLRDVAAAYNRDPGLFEAKVSRIYVNAGHSAHGVEWNVDLDRHAYFRILLSPLPVYWMPCFGEDGYFSYWKFKQSDVLDSAPLSVQNFFIYALNHASTGEFDPIQFLKMPISEDVKKNIWEQERNMWCTAGFSHAASRPNGTFTFKNMNLIPDVASATTQYSSNSEGIPVLTFYCENRDIYTKSMTETLCNLLAGLGRESSPPRLGEIQRGLNR